MIMIVIQHLTSLFVYLDLLFGLVFPSIVYYFIFCVIEYFFIHSLFFYPLWLTVECTYCSLPKSSRMVDISITTCIITHRTHIIFLSS
jgi:hypothetical protein